MFWGWVSQLALSKSASFSHVLNILEGMGQEGGTEAAPLGGVPACLTELCVTVAGL